MWRCAAAGSRATLGAGTRGSGNWLGLGHAGGRGWGPQGHAPWITMLRGRAQTTRRVVGTQGSGPAVHACAVEAQSLLGRGRGGDQRGWGPPPPHPTQAPSPVACQCGLPTAGQRVPSHHAECGGLTSSIHSQQTETLRKPHRRRSARAQLCPGAANSWGGGPSVCRRAVSKGDPWERHWGVQVAVKLSRGREGWL